VHTLAVSRDGRTLITGYFGSQTQLWDLSTGLPRGKPQNHAGDVVSAQISPDGRSLLVQTENDTVNVFAAFNGHFLAREQKVRKASYTADGAALIAGSSEGWVRIRELQAGPRHTTAPVPTGIGTLHAVAFSPDGRLAVLAGAKGAQLCHPETWEPIGEMLPHEWPVTAAVFSPDGRTLVTSQLGERKSLTSGHPGKLRFWEAATGRPIGEPIALASSAWTLVFDTTGETLLAGPWLCNVNTRELTAYDPFDPKGETRSVAHLVQSLPSPVPKLWDASKKEPVHIRIPVENSMKWRIPMPRLAPRGTCWRRCGTLRRRCGTAPAASR